MLNLNEIKELIELLDKTSIQELEIENEGSRISIRKPGKTEVVQVQPAVVTSGATPAAVPVNEPVNRAVEAISADSSIDQGGLHAIVSPMVGTFYRAASPEANSFVNVGDRVGEKTTVCIIEAMKLMNEIEAEVKGEIVKVLVENGQLVEYGQPLFLVKPE